MIIVVRIALTIIEIMLVKALRVTFIVTRKVVVAVEMGIATMMALIEVLVFMVATISNSASFIIIIVATETEEIEKEIVVKMVIKVLSTKKIASKNFLFATK